MGECNAVDCRCNVNAIDCSSVLIRVTCPCFVSIFFVIPWNTTAKPINNGWHAM